MSFLKSLPENATLLDVFKKFPATSVPLIEYHEALLRGPSPFTAAERELIAAYVSGLNACEYCHQIHGAIAKSFGVSEALIGQLLENIETAPVDEKIKPVLRYVHKLTKTPSRMTQADADAILASGWDDNALHDAASVCALFNMMNRLVDGTGIKSDPNYAKLSSKRLIEISYKGLAKMLKC